MNFTYDREKLIELMKDFYSLTKIKTAILTIEKAD